MKYKKSILSAYLILFMAFLTMPQLVICKTKLLNGKFIYSIDSSNVSEINKLLSNYESLERLSGSIIIAQNDTILVKRSFGYSKKQKPNKLTTAFNIASLSKQFTAAAILQLAFQEKLSLNSTINAYLGKYASKKWKKVTIHQLLTHTSGIPSLFQSGQGLDHVLPKPDPIEWNELISTFNNLKLISNPGKEFNYCNSGYMLLAAIIENVSNMSFKAYMENELFVPYGLLNTTVGPPAKNEFAKPFFNYREDLVKDAPLNHYSWTLGASGIYTTVEDLYMWMQLLNSDVFLNGKYKKQLFTGQVEITNGYSYSYGWEIVSGKEKIVQHDGGDLGYISSFRYFPERDLSIIILTNQTHDCYEAIDFSHNHIQQILKDIVCIINKGETNLPPFRNGNNEIPENLMGTYELDEDKHIIIEKEGQNICSIKNSNQQMPFIFNMAMEFPIENNSDSTKLVYFIANCIKNKQIKPLKEHLTPDMKIAANLGILKLGINMLLKPVGIIDKVTPYKLSHNYVLIRYKGNKGICDLKIYFGEHMNIEGIFEHNSKKMVRPFPVKAYCMEENKLLIDGFPFQEEDAYIMYDSDGELIKNVRLVHFNRVFELKKCSFPK